MKTQIFTLIRSAVLASLLAAVASAHARGGVGDGGGNVQPESLMDSSMIRKNIERAKLPTRLALQRLEFTLSGVTGNGETEKMLTKLNAKIFGGPKDILQALDEAKFNPREFGTCAAADGADRDASANPTTSEICFSLQALEGKLHDNSGNAELIGLVAHEVSHLVGTTEEEAVMVQTMVQSTIGSSESSTIFEYARDAKTKFDNDLTGIINGFEGALAYAKLGNVTGMCTFLPMSVSQLSNSQSGFYETGSNSGLSVLRKADIWLLSAAVIKAMNAIGVCYQSLMAKENLRTFRKPFGGKKQISLREFYSAFWHYDSSSNAMLALPNMIVRDVTGGDKTAIQAEIKDILNLLKKIQNNSK